MAEDMEGVMLENEAHSVIARFRDGVADAKEAAILQGYFVEGRAEETLAKELGITRYKLRQLIATLQSRMEKYLRQHDVLVT